MKEQERYRWMATHVLPWEGAVRQWLRCGVHTLSATEIDEVVQEAYARVWRTDFARISDGRRYFHSIVRNLLSEKARTARVVPLERMKEIDALPAVSGDPGQKWRASPRQQLERMLHTIADLPAQCRRVFEAHTFDGQSKSEISRRLRLSEKKVEHYLAQALACIVAKNSMIPSDSENEGLASRTRRAESAEGKD